MNPSIRAYRTTQDERNNMKKFFLILCLSTASINAMDSNLKDVKTTSNQDEISTSSAQTSPNHHEQKSQEESSDLTSLILALCAALY